MPSQPESMTPAERQASLLRLSKLLLDEDRLKILGLLAQHPCSTATVQRELSMERAPIHLQKLTEAGLTHRFMQQNEEWYQLDTQQIFAYKKQLFAPTADQQPQASEAKEIAKFIKHERLIRLPLQPSTLHLVLAWLAQKFQPHVAYSEKAINELLQGHAIDHATLRRLLVDHQLLTRQAGIYQRQVEPRQEQADGAQ
ncbi:MAG: DUF2087 domain-containing protein [Caldilineaceae bacterium]|nr:DUF2087 domain-containing protein [Caldilineaceae bacterium]